MQPVRRQRRDSGEPRRASVRIPFDADTCAARLARERTSRVEMSTVIYNPKYELFLLVGVNFYFNKGGHIFKLIHLQSSWQDTLPQIKTQCKRSEVFKAL